VLSRSTAAGRARTEDARPIERATAAGRRAGGATIQPETLTSSRSEIVGLAREILAHEGAASVTLGRVARELGRNLSSVYEHFASEEELLACLAADALLEQTRQIEDAGGDLLEQLRAYRRFALERPAQYRLLTESPLGSDSPLDGLSRCPPRALIDRLGGGLARAAWAFAHGMVELELDGRLARNADLEATWELGVAAFAAAADGKGKPEAPSPLAA
jgi:AcrR family transcriptional regulator